jgi:cyclohexanone monooxygenase
VETGTRQSKTTIDVLVVGAGFAGMYLIYRLRQMNLTFHVVEAGSDVGGTWYWNRYPGARCDADSVYYSYSFDTELEQGWRWTERNAPQTEILSYIDHVADKHDLRRHITFNTRVRAAAYDERSECWTVETDTGAEIICRYLIFATGCLSKPHYPKFKGADSFAGDVYHTGRWPHHPVSFKHQRVGVVGTGSSAIQAIPEIAKEADQLYVFQRTPNFSIPARNAPLSDEYVAEVKTNYANIRQECRSSFLGMPVPSSGKNVHDCSRAEQLQILDAAWEKGGSIFIGAFNDTVICEKANVVVADYVRSKIADIVEDAETASKLMPTSYPIGTKRICVDTDYYAAFNRPNVTLVDVLENPIEEIIPSGLRTHAAKYSFDALVYATGFDAMTGALLDIDIRGRRDRSLREKWQYGPQTYLGLMSHGFPNMFMITGPGSPSVISNVITSIEQHVDFVIAMIERLERDGVRTIEAEPEAEEAWVARVNAMADETLFSKAKSWWNGSNIPGKPRVFMPFLGVGAYREICDKIAMEDYPGFAKSRFSAHAEPQRSTDG